MGMTAKSRPLPSTPPIPRCSCPITRHKSLVEAADFRSRVGDPPGRVAELWNDGRHYDVAFVVIGYGCQASRAA